MEIKIILNDQEKSFEVNPGDMLLDVLQKHGIMSVKHGCDTGTCGACTVLLDDKPILSCSFLAIHADGHKVYTTEGKKEQVIEFAEFLTAEGAEQCGFCGPALALTTISMKKELQNPSDKEIKDYLAGNLCRCSGYSGQLRAIKKYLEVK
jgi:carbon-monoxide dehydrogenase small subunit